MNIANILSASMALTLALVGVSAHAHADTEVEIETYAECVTEGGETSSIELQIFPSQISNKCEINGHVFVEGRGEVSSHEDKKTDRDGDLGVTLENRNRAEIQTRIEDRRAELQANKEERRAALSVQAQNRIELFASGLFRRMDAAVNKLMGIADRIETRIEKIENEMESDLSAQSEMLVNAKARIETAEVLVQEAKVNLEVMVESENPREDFEVLRESLNSAKSALREARQSLFEVLGSIRAEIDAEANAGVGVDTR